MTEDDDRPLCTRCSARRLGRSEQQHGICWACRNLTRWTPPTKETP